MIILSHPPGKVKALHLNILWYASKICLNVPQPAMMRAKIKVLNFGPFF